MRNLSQNCPCLGIAMPSMTENLVVSPSNLFTRYSNSNFDILRIVCLKITVQSVWSRDLFN